MRARGAPSINGEVGQFSGWRAAGAERQLWHCCTTISLLPGHRFVLIAIEGLSGDICSIPNSDSPELGRTFDTRGKTMKKVLLATTALTLSAGVAYAEVSVSGNARMGLQYKSGSAAVAGSAGYAEAKTAYNNAVTAATMVRGVVTAAGSAASADQILAADQADAEVDRTAALLAAQTAPVAATNGATTLEKRMTVTMSGSVETTSGLTLGATMNLRANEGAAAVASGARVSLATGGFELAVGNIYGAIDSMPGVYSASAGLTGLGWGGVLSNTGAKGSWGWDSYSSSGNGSEGVEVIYSAGSVTAHLSYSDSDLGSSANRTAAYVSYAMGDWTIAAGMQDSTVNTEDKTIVTVGGKVGDFGVGVGYADNDGEAKIALNGSATFGATTVSMYVANEESATDNPMGLGIKHDLGGASLVGGVAKTATGQTRADMGVSFSF